MKTFRRIGKATLLFATLLLLMMALIGCQSVDTREATLNIPENEEVDFQYDRSKDQTRISWSTTIENDTIYHMTEFKVTFDLFCENEYLGAQTYYYDCLIRHGDDHKGTFTFSCDGKVDGADLVSWTARFADFWEIYGMWIIVASILVIVAAVVYIFAVRFFEIEWEEVIEFFEEGATWLFPIGIVLVGTISGLGIWFNWVNACIVGGAIVLLLLFVAIIHLVQYFLDREHEDEDFFDVEDYLDDREALESFTKIALIEYCRENGLLGYSKLNKEELIDFIIEQSEREEQEELAKESAPVRQSKKKSTTGEPKKGKLGFSDIAGLEEAKDAFREKVILPFEHRELFEKYGKKVGGGILLYGLPGTGKTMFAEACANELDALFIPIKCSDIKSKWYGESEENVKKIFAKARKADRAIIFFDEFEAIGAKRTDDTDNGNNDLVPQILAEMQGVGTADSSAVIMVIAATNKPWAIDSAFLRPGRFDEKIYIPLPDYAARKKIFELKLKATPTENLDFSYLSQITEGYNGADVTEFCEKLKMEAIKQSIATQQDHIITMADVEKIKAKMKSSVSVEDVENLQEFEQA